MKKFFITALVFGISFAGISQNKEAKTEIKQEKVDSTMKTKANYNTTRSNKKSIKAPDKTTIKKETSKSGGTNAIKPNFNTILERKKMR